MPGQSARRWFESNLEKLSVGFHLKQDPVLIHLKKSLKGTKVI